MLPRPTGSAVPDHRAVVDDTALLDAFWRDVTRKIARNYPEMTEDDVRERVATLLLDVHTIVRLRRAEAPGSSVGNSAMLRLRAACSAVVGAAAGAAAPATR